MEHYNHVKTVVMASVRANKDREDESVVDPVTNPSFEEDIKDGWRVLSAFPCVLHEKAAGIIAVLAKC